MKILHVNKFFYNKGGAESYLFSLSELQAKNKHRVIFFSQKNKKNLPTEEDKYFIKNLELGKINLPALFSLSRLFWSFEAGKKIDQLIKDYQPDLVHIHNIYHQISPSILPVIKKHGLPIVMTVHDFKLIKADYTLPLNKQYFQWLNPKKLILAAEYFWHKQTKIYQNNIDFFIAPSSFVKDRLAEKEFDKNKIIVVPHFIDLKSYPKKQKTKSNYILFFGRLDKSKGVILLLQAWKSIAANYPKIKLIIAGTGPQETELKNYCQKNFLKNIKFVGKKEPKELKKIISDSLFIVLPSQVHETFGLAVLESFGCFKAVVGTKAGGFSELISDKKNGLLIDNDAKSLAEAIKKLLDNPKKALAMGQAARKTAAKYTSEKHLKKIEKIYQRALKIKIANEASIFNLRKALASTAILTLIILVQQFLLVPTNHLTEDSMKLANLYWKTPITKEEAQALAKWDLVVLDMQAQTTSAENIKYLRTLNPKIKILAYTTATEIPKDRLKEIEPQGDGLWHELVENFDPAWQLKTHDGKNISWWLGNIATNLTFTNAQGQTYGDYFSDFIKNKVIVANLWDGVLLDNVWQDVSWVDKNIDIDNDGKFDDESKINAAWQKGNEDFLKKLRQKMGNEFLIIGNGVGQYHNYLNGRMLEGFPEFYENGWQGSFDNYLKNSQIGFQPRLNILDSDTDSQGSAQDYQKMRFGLASALMSDGYYSFSFGPKLREHLWWYDEYDVNLGKAISPAQNISSNTTSTGIWIRKFQGGLVILNSSNKLKKVKLPKNHYIKLFGQQDKAVNNGLTVNLLYLPPQDGLILLNNANYGNNLPLLWLDKWLKRVMAVK